MSNSQDDLIGYMPIHASADGYGWKGTTCSTQQQALRVAFAYADANNIEHDEMMVLGIYPGSNTTGRMPPNPLARRKISTPVTMDLLDGEWTIIRDTPSKDYMQHSLSIANNASARTDFGTSHLGKHVMDDAKITVFHGSAFSIELTRGESYMFAVTRFDGNAMDVFLDGVDDQPLRLERVEASKANE